MAGLQKKHQDYLLTLAVFALTAFGLIMIYSVSKYYSLQLTDGATDKYYLKKQLVSVAMALLAWIVFQNVDYSYWRKKINFMFFATLILLVMPLLFAGGSGERWISFFGFQFQPAELAKLTLIIYLSGWFAGKSENLREIEGIFLPFIMVMSLIAGLMLIQKDLGTLSVIMLITAAIFIVAGFSVIHIVAAGGLVTFLLFIAIKLEPYRLQRILTFLNPENNTLGSSYHIRNALIAIGSGGLWGLGFGQSRQKYLYLPEAHTDSIFAITVEELGFLRSSLIIVFFVLVALRGYKIASQAPDVFSRLMAVGITTWIIAQAFVNIAAMLGMVPLTGVPLPFVSYGGSSLIFLMAGVGILTNISKNQRA